MSFLCIYAYRFRLATMSAVAAVFVIVIVVFLDGRDRSGGLYAG